MIYLTVKALHVASVILWMSGMIATALLLNAFRGRESAFDEGWAPTLRRALRRTMAIGIAATWLLGGWLFVDGGWFQSPWMFTKLGFVLALSALHGPLVAHLKRIGTVEDYRVPAWMGPVVPAKVAAVTLIAFLVIAKPF